MGFVWVVTVIAASALLLSMGVSLCMRWQQREARRADRLRAAAGALSMQVQPALPGELDSTVRLFASIEKAGQAGAFRIFNVLAGRRRRRGVVFFDYECVTTHLPELSWEKDPGGALLNSISDDRVPETRVRRMSAVAAETGFDARPVRIRPEGLLDKAAALAGWDDIDFGLMPEFSRRFFVTGEDEVFARKLVTPPLADCFVERVRGRVEFRGRWLLLTEDRRLSPAEVSSQVELASLLAEVATGALARWSP